MGKIPFVITYNIITLRFLNYSLNNKNDIYKLIGYFYSNYSGAWTFYLSSDDCSYLWIGNYAISGYTTSNADINNGGLHSMQEKSTTINLSNNTYYPIRIQYGEFTGGNDIYVSFSNPNLNKTSNGINNFYYIKNYVMK